MAKLTGTNPEQVPTNADLGDMAYKDGENLQAGPLTITDGKVGIGTQSPLYALHVEDDSTGQQAFLSSSSSNGTSLGFQSTSTNGKTYRIGSNFLSGQGEFAIYDQNSAVGRMVVQTTGEVQVTSGLLELNGNDIGGTQVTIADDAVASITPPRNGGFMFVTCQGDTDYPQTGLSSYFEYDVGASLGITELLSKVYVDVSVSDVTGTTGTDSKVTVAVQSGVIKIENRLGYTANFQITFL